MLLLALDTSTQQSSIALCSSQEILGEYTWRSGNNHSVELLEHIQRLMTLNQMTLQQLDAVAVAIGPGSFNGVRVALASAKALAFSLQKPLLGVSTLDIIAAQQRWNGPLCAVLEAGRSELYAAYYLSQQQESGGEIFYHVERISEYLLLSPQSLVSFWQQQGDQEPSIPDRYQQAPLLFCGELRDVSRQAVQTYMQQRALFLPPAHAIRRAAVLAEIAQQRLLEGKKDDPLVLEPLYLRRPSITTSARKQPLLGHGQQHTTMGQDKTEREEGALRH